MKEVMLSRALSSKESRKVQTIFAKFPMVPITDHPSDQTELDVVSLIEVMPYKNRNALFRIITPFCLKQVVTPLVNL
jgi:hypothetical protein